MNDVYVEAFKNQIFNQDGNELVILKMKNYNSPNFMFENLPVKEKIKNIEVNRLRNGYIKDTLACLDIQKNVKMSGKVVEIYEGVIYRENFKISPFRRAIEKLFAL